MKRLIFIIPLFFLAGCGVNVKEWSSVEQLFSDKIASLKWSIKVLDDKINAVDKWTTKLFWDYDTGSLSDNEWYVFMKDEVCAEDTFIAPWPADWHWNCYDVQKRCDEYCNFWELTKTDLCIPWCLEKLQ